MGGRVVAALVVVVVSLAAAAGARADVVYLKNGNDVRGTVVEDSPERVVVETKNGRLTFRRSLVDRVERTSPPPAPPAAPTERGPTERAPTAPTERAPAGATSAPATARGAATGGTGGLPVPAPVRVPGLPRPVEPTVQARLGSLVRRGERWVYSRRLGLLPEALRYTLLEQALMDPSQQAEDGEVTCTVLRLGLEALATRSEVPGRPPAEREWRYRGAPAARRDPGEPPPTYETLTVSGRALRCQVVERTRKVDDELTRRERLWIHVDAAGARLFPEEVKVEVEGIVVAELLRIDPPVAGALPPLPDLSELQVGQRWIQTDRTTSKEVQHTWTVSRIGQDEAELLQQTPGGGSSARIWRPRPGRVGESRGLLQPKGQHPFAISGRVFLTILVEQTSASGVVERTWTHIDEDRGEERFPGVLKRERGGVVLQEFVRIEPPAP